MEPLDVGAAPAPEPLQKKSGSSQKNALNNKYAKYDQIFNIYPKKNIKKVWIRIPKKKLTRKKFACDQFKGIFFIFFKGGAGAGVGEYFSGSGSEPPKKWRLRLRNTGKIF